MSAAAAFFLYAVLRQVTLIAAGVTSLLLGYRLLRLGTSSASAATETSFRPFKILRSNILVGTVFSLFGMALITITVSQGNPQLSDKGKLMSQSANKADEISALIQEGLAFDRSGNTEQAAASYQNALSILATAMSQLARQDLRRGQAEQGLPLASLAVTLSPQRAEVLDTMAEILAKTGDVARARKWKEKAAAIDPKYRQAPGPIGAAKE